MKINNIILFAGMKEIHQKLQKVLRTKNLSYGETEDACLGMATSYEDYMKMNIFVKKEGNNIATHREFDLSVYSSKVRKLPRDGFWKIFPDDAVSCEWKGKFVMMPVLKFEDISMYIKDGRMDTNEMIAFWRNKDSFEPYSPGKHFNYFIPELDFSMQQQDVFQHLSKREEHRIQSFMSLNFDIKLLNNETYINRDRITIFKDITFALFKKDTLLFMGTGSAQELDPKSPHRSNDVFSYASLDDDDIGKNDLPF